MYEIKEVVKIRVSEGVDYYNSDPINWLMVEFKLTNDIIYEARFLKHNGENMPSHVSMSLSVFEMFPEIAVYSVEWKELEEKYELSEEIKERVKKELLSDKRIKLKAFFLKETDTKVIRALQKPLSEL